MIRGSNCIVLLASVLCIAVIPACLMVFYQGVGNTCINFNGTAKIGTSASLGVITITGDAELAAFPNKTGAGIEINPYVIEGFTISGPGTSPSHAIKITNTTAWLVIKNCVLTNRNDSFVNWWNNNVGIRILSCSNVNITQNIITRCAAPISVSYSTHCFVMGNDLYPDDSAGVHLVSCNDSYVLENQFISGGIGIAMDYSNRITCSRNDFVEEYDCIIAHDCNNITISENNLSRSGTGINLEDSSNNTISNNTLSWFHEAGIILAGTNDTRVMWNFVRIQNVDATGTIYDRPVIFLYNSSGNTISCNAFWGEPLSTTGNQWDNGTHGNFWGNYYARYNGRTEMYGNFWTTPYEIDSMYLDEKFHDEHPLVHLPGYHQPLIYTPIHLDLISGAIGVQVTWMPVTETWSVIEDLSHAYSIYKDGVLLRTGTWFPYSLITVNLDWITGGFYNYTIVVSDGMGGVARDTVIITVRPGILGMDYTVFTTIVIILAVLFVVMIWVLWSRGKLRKRVKEKVASSRHELGNTGTETLAALARSSSSISVSQLAVLLEVNESFVWENIARWANKFGFHIQNDKVIFENGNIEAFVEDLDKKFTEWDKNTRDKLGKT